MKIQHIAVIFIIIIIPILVVTTFNINSQIQTIKLQSTYNSKLIRATYDAVQAFQINTVNNRYSSISDSKIRDIEAAVSTFYNILSTSENLTKEDLHPYVPALVFTLYDGYYIYSKYDNVVKKDDSNFSIIADENVLKSSSYTNIGLKPYIYYSCRYKKGSNIDFVVNFTLDNAITIYGQLPTITKIGNTYQQTGSYSYQTLSGYLINPDNVELDRNYNENDINTYKLTYKGSDSSKDIEIATEVLTEHLLFANEDNGDYTYIVYNGQKIYYDASKSFTPTSTPYFYYQNYSKSYISNSTTNNVSLIPYLIARTAVDGLHSTSAFEYYKEAKEFSEKVKVLTKGISQKDAINVDGTQLFTLEIDSNEKQNNFIVDTGDDEIFVADSNNDPLLSGSTFNENRMLVIRNSIQTNLIAAIANYSSYSSNTFEYAFPELSEVDWEKITNNVSVISFLQGIPIGHKIYNNYCVITNDNNEEVVKKENIYIITNNASTNEREYHLPGCTHILPEKSSDIDANIQIEDSAYSSLSFIRQTVRLSEGNYIYFYPQTRNTNKILTSCYYCIVNASNVYSIDDIIRGEIVGKNDDWEDEVIIKTNGTDRTSELFRKIRKLYLTALGRERYDLYQVNMANFNT